VLTTAYRKHSIIIRDRTAALIYSMVRVRDRDRSVLLLQRSSAEQLRNLHLTFVLTLSLVHYIKAIHSGQNCRTAKLTV